MVAGQLPCVQLFHIIMCNIHIYGASNMISSRQIRAARGLLGWTQTHLAQAADMHLNAINKIENEAGVPRTLSLTRIKKTLEMAGVRFRAPCGVELREDVFELARFDGKDFMRRAIDDVIAIVRRPEDEILTCTPDEKLFNQSDRAQNDRYYRHMKRYGFRERIITGRDYHLFANESKASYRWLPGKVLGTVTYVVYGDRVAFINWGMAEVLAIRSTSLAATFRGQFEFLWQQAKLFA